MRMAWVGILAGHAAILGALTSCSRQVSRLSSVSLEVGAPGPAGQNLPPAPLPVGPAPALRIVEASGAVIRGGDRHYVASVLSGIYGLPENTDPILNSLILSYVAVFGGPCDPYAETCGAPSSTLSPMIPPPGAARGALVTRACELIHAQDSAVQYAVRHLEGRVFDSTLPPDDGGVLKAYQAFYPGRAPTPGLLNALSGVASEAAADGRGTGLEGWRFLLLTLCLAPDWQVP